MFYDVQFSYSLVLKRWRVGSPFFPNCEMSFSDDPKLYSTFSNSTFSPYANKTLALKFDRGPKFVFIVIIEIRKRERTYLGFFSC